MRSTEGVPRVNPTQQQITEVFERHLRQFGYDKTNLDDVARELHISKKTIYVHFDGKRDIYAGIVERVAAQEKARLAAVVAELPTNAAKLEAVMRLLLEMARTHIAETGRDEWLREFEVAAEAFAKANGDLIRELVQAGMDSGEFPTGDAVFVERMLSAMTLEYLRLVNNDPTFDRDAELLQRMLKFIG